jgi:hypothetical protein
MPSYPTITQIVYLLIGMLAGELLPNGDPRQSAIIYTTTSTAAVSAACEIILYNVGATPDYWCMPIGVVSGAVAGTVWVSRLG